MASPAMANDLQQGHSAPEQSRPMSKKPCQSPNQAGKSNLIGQNLSSFPLELKKALTANKKAGAAFKSMSKGKQREYTEYISAAKRPETKQKRLRRFCRCCMDGIGLNDKYRKC